MPPASFSEIGIVAIGRNEGDRLARCLASVRGLAAHVVYVDSGSTDGSVAAARDAGSTVVELDMRLPFTAARARNAGFARLQELVPDVQFVQFVDGDCEIAPHWIEAAAAFLVQNRQAAVVCGRRRERFPEQSVYNWLCDREWDTPVGKAKACGGDAMMRVEAFRKINGYRADLIAGEEPELCVRLRADGWDIWRLDAEMTLHDAALSHFGQWWRRTVRSGYALAQGVFLHGTPPERHKVWESQRAWIWGFWLPLAGLAAPLLFGWWGLSLWLIFPLQFMRQFIRSRGSLTERALVALFQMLSRFAETWGQIKFKRDRLFGQQTRIIEYK